MHKVFYVKDPLDNECMLLFPRGLYNMLEKDSDDERDPLCGQNDLYSTMDDKNITRVGLNSLNPN